MKVFCLLLLILSQCSWAETTPWVTGVKQQLQAQNKAIASRQIAINHDLDALKQQLMEAKGQLATLREQSTQLSSQNQSHKQKLDALQQQYQIKSGSLSALFNAIRTLARELAPQFKRSATYGEDPTRADFMAQLAQGSDQVPSQQLRQFGQSLLSELQQGGQVSRFRAMVFGKDGQGSEQDVVRIGPFNLLSAAGYLQQNNGILAELERPVPSYYQQQARKFVQSVAATHPLYLDPFEGKNLKLLAQQPTLWERMRQGGVIGWVIIVLSTAGVLIACWRLWVLGRISLRVRHQLRSDLPEGDNPLGRVFAVYQENPKQDVTTLELRLDEAILRELAPLERGISIIKIFAAVAPMLGLLGTVSGMIGTFQAINNFGSADPSVMAGGISMALVTTVLGLVAAIPLIFLHSMVQSRSSHLIHLLEHQAAGLIAKRAEKQAARC